MAPAVAETPPQDEHGARDKLLHRMVRQVCFLQAAEGRRSARRPVASWVEAGRSHPPSPNGAKDARRSDRRPRQNSTGGKARLGGISKRADGYLRHLLVTGAHAVLLRYKPARLDPWLIAASQASHGGRRGGGQQDGTHRLRDHEQE